MHRRMKDIFCTHPRKISQLHISRAALLTKHTAPEGTAAACLCNMLPLYVNKSIESNRMKQFSLHNLRFHNFQVHRNILMSFTSWSPGLWNSELRKLLAKFRKNILIPFSGQKWKWKRKQFVPLTPRLLHYTASEPRRRQVWITAVKTSVLQRIISKNTSISTKL